MNEEVENYPVYDFRISVLSLLTIQFVGDNTHLLSFSSTHTTRICGCQSNVNLHSFLLFSPNFAEFTLHIT